MLKMGECLPSTLTTNFSPFGGEEDLPPTQTQGKIDAGLISVESSVLKKTQGFSAFFR